MSRPESQTDSRITASVERLRHELDRWVEAAVSQGGRALDAIGLRSTDRPWIPAADIIESPESILVTIDLPGVDPRSVDISLTGNMLTIKGEKALLVATEGQTLHMRERAAGPFERSLPLPVPVDADSVEAEGKDGVIKIRFNVSKPAKSRQIPINPS